MSTMRSSVMIKELNNHMRIFSIAKPAVNKYHDNTSTNWKFHGIDLNGEKSGRRMSGVIIISVAAISQGILTLMCWRRKRRTSSSGSCESNVTPTGRTANEASEFVLGGLEAMIVL